MRGKDFQQQGMFSYLSPEERVPRNHPLRKIKKMTDKSLDNMSESFSKIYSAVGRPSIPPEQLLRAMLLQVLYSIRSERMLAEQLQYNLLFRWFVGLSMEDPSWNHSTFSKNRDRLISGEIADLFFKEILGEAEKKHLLSSEHFTVDGTIIEAWASIKSIRPKDEDGPSDKGDRNPERDFHGEKWTNATHASTTDPEARLYKKGKGKEAKLCYMGHILMENRNGLVVNATVTHATGTAETDAAIKMINDISTNKKKTIGADKGYDSGRFVKKMRAMKTTPHVAKKKIGKTIDKRTTRHAGYQISLRKRKRVEEIFGWLKTIGPIRKTKYKGISRISRSFTFASTVFNLVRMANIESNAQ